jgi:alkanesulfonate monooxygenase SsuD/methylene tetrahydromethanopterin reductase-like flavin-dependent oxidoreductase (luciferase family)
VRFGVFLPNFGPFADPAALVGLATETEAAGWDGLFLWDHILFGDAQPVLDPWIGLTAVAAATSRLRLGALVTPVARRRPWKLARETATLDHLSGGRLVFGAGLGFPPDVEFGTFGEPEDDRVRAAMLDEGLAVLAGLWSGEEFAFAGEHYSVRPTTFLPTPVQRPRIPVWVAGWWPNKRPFRRAARWDGVVPELVGGGTPTPDDVAEMTAFVAANRARDGPFDVAVNGYSSSRDGMEPYEAAGATWWLERIDPEHRFSLEAARERIVEGPPRVA